MLSRAFNEMTFGTNCHYGAQFHQILLDNRKYAHVTDYIFLVIPDIFLQLT